MFTHAEKQKQHWIVRNDLGHGLMLPCREAYDNSTIEIATMGTGARNFTRRAGEPIRAVTMAMMLKSLERPIYLLDTRRDGVGGQGSWSPLELLQGVTDQLQEI